MLVEGLVAYLPTVPVLASALNISTRSDGSNGIWPAIAPDEPLAPYIVFVQIGRTTTLSYQGINRLQQAKFRFSCYAVSYRSAKYLAEALKGALDGLVTLLPDGTPLESTEAGTEVDDVEQDLKATIYATHLDYTFVYVDVNVQ